MALVTFNPITYGSVSFTNIQVSEVDTGTVAAFSAIPGIDAGLPALIGSSLVSAFAIEAAHAGVYGAGSSETLNLSYTVSASSGNVINSMDQLYVADIDTGPGVSMTAVETLTNPITGAVVGTNTFTLGGNNVPAIALTQNLQSVNVSVQLTMSISATTGTSASELILSQLEQSFGTQAAPQNTASIGDIVFLDSTGSGLESGFDSGPGVAGVTVELLNANGTSVLATTTTDSHGLYSFTGLAAGVYEVEFVAPKNYAFTQQGVGNNPGVNSSANQITGITAPITLTAGQADHNVEAGLVSTSGGSGQGSNTASIGTVVWLDTNHDGLLDNGEKGVAGVTVELLNGNGSTILATTTTNATGNYSFNNLAAGTYEVKFLPPAGDTFTTQGVGSNPAVNSSPNTSTGVTAPITLTAGQVDNNVEAGLQQGSGITVLKVPCTVVVNQCGQETYTFYVTNTGATALTNVKIQDNIGTAANPDYVTPTLVTQGTNGILQPGQTWTYTETIAQIGCTSLSNGSVCHSASGSNLGGGCTAWFSSSFDPKSCADGATYKFQGITCTIQGSGTGGHPITINCPDSEVVFSSSCKSATTAYDSNQDCWITTLPANCNPGSVFLTGAPQQIPYGYNLSGCSVTWNIGDASNNCGATSINWDGSCTGYSSFSQNGCNGLSDYNSIGVKSCDNLSGYGNGGNCNVGYGFNGSSYSDCGYNPYGGGCGYYYNQAGWDGSASDNCGTPENQFTQGNCGNTSCCNTSYNYSNCGSFNAGGYYGGWGCGSSYGYGGGSACGTGSSSGGSCGDSGSATQNCGTTSGSADTVTVSAQVVTGTKTTSNGCGGTTTTVTTGATVTASDTKEVEILGSNSNVTLDGTVPTGSLSSLYGAAKTLEFVYNPGNTVSLVQSQSGMGNVSGTNVLTSAYMVIENQAGTQIYFEGEVTAGELIYADAALNPLTNTPITNGQFSTAAGASIVADIYTSQAAFMAGASATQVDTYNTSGSQAMHLGDTVGSLQLDGYVGAKGGHIVDSTTSTSTLTLNMSEDAYQGDAQFTVSVNGQQVGGVMTVNALHATGDSEVFVLTGNWSASSADQVAITFINDAYDGTASTDRNLYVNSVSLNGTTYANTSAAMNSNGTDTFTVGGATKIAAAPADVLTLNLSEDYYQGDAQFELFVDGKQISSAQSVTTLNSSGQSEAFTFSGNFGAGNHTVGIEFMNDAYNGTASTDRNLYVNSISLNGAAIANSSATPDSNGTANFSIYTAH